MKKVTDRDKREFKEINKKEKNLCIKLLPFWNGLLDKILLVYTSKREIVRTLTIFI